MNTQENSDQISKALEALDGDREAMPLISLYKLRLQAREEARAWIDQAPSYLKNLTEGCDQLEDGIADLEREILELAEHNEGDNSEPFEFAYGENHKGESVDELRRRIAEGIQQSLEKIRHAASAHPESPIPLAQLKPTFAAGASAKLNKDTLDVPGIGAIPGMNVGSGTGARAARQSVQSMLSNGIDKSMFAGPDGKTFETPKEFKEALMSGEIQMPKELRSLLEAAGIETPPDVPQDVTQNVKE